MRWPPFMLALANLILACYLLIINVFTTKDINPLAFLWYLAYIVLSLAVAHLYTLYMINRIDDWYDVESISSITNLSIVCMLIFALSLAIDLGLDYYKNNTLTLFNNNNLIKNPVVPLMASLICSVILFTSSIKFKKYVFLCQSVDLQPTQQKRNYRTAY